MTRPAALKSPYEYEWSRATKVGEGSFGKVYRVLRINRSTRKTRILAIKTARHDTSNITDRELKILSTLKANPHQNIVKYCGHFFSNARRPFKGALHICLTFEFLLAGDLDHKNRSSDKRFKAKTLKRYIFGALHGLLHLHERLKIVHRDIKPANILIGANNVPKISDFGVSKILPNGTKVKFIGSWAGTFYYLAPETWEYGLCFKSDVWALGVVFHELATKRIRPYAIGQSQNFIERLKKDDDAPMLRGIEEFLGPNYKQKIPLEEIDWKNSLWTKHYVGAASLLKAMLIRAGNSRPGPRVLMRHPWFSDLDEVAVVRQQLGIPHKSVTKKSSTR